MYLLLLLLVCTTRAANYDQDYQDYIDYLEEVEKLEIEYMLQSISVGKLTAITEGRCPSCSCGIANRWPRIVGGWVTEVNEYPWMAALSHKGNLFCGGTLISEEYVLTAAHCLVRSTDNNTADWVMSSVSVVLAEHNIAQMGETMTESFKVTDVFVHPDFSRATFDHDLALLKLHRKVRFRQGIGTACLPPPDKEYSGEWATVAGWGLTKEGGSISAYLRETTVPVLSQQQCRRRGYQPHRITDNMLCAGDYNMMDSCQGDSGGALLVTNKFLQMMTVGIVSWGEGCARPRKPGVYTRVDKHIDWILQTSQDSCYCL